MQKCEGCVHNCSGWCVTAKILLIIGGINWGLIGLGMLLGGMPDWNVVHIIFGGAPVIEAIIYLLVGVAAVMKIFGSKCKKCKLAGSASMESSQGNTKQGA